MRTTIEIQRPRLSLHLASRGMQPARYTVRRNGEHLGDVRAAFGRRGGLIGWRIDHAPSAGLFTSAEEAARALWQDARARLEI